MNKICKEYISDAKKFFPIMGKKERAYLRGIVSELEDCIERESITSKQELYVKYRQPYDLANDYYSRFETDEIVKKIRISKHIKALISIIIIIALVSTSISLFNYIKVLNTYNREEMVGYSETDEQPSKHEDIQSNNYESHIDKIDDEEIIEEDEIIE